MDGKWARGSSDFLDQAREYDHPEGIGQPPLG
jgi:hypothetical protein